VSSSSSSSSDKTDTSDNDSDGLRLGRELTENTADHVYIYSQAHRFCRLVSVKGSFFVARGSLY
jgi:hypothetical protein